jgi:hypothetical protein
VPSAETTERDVRHVAQMHAGDEARVFVCAAVPVPGDSQSLHDHVVHEPHAQVYLGPMRLALDGRAAAELKHVEPRVEHRRRPRVALRAGGVGAAVHLGVASGPLEVRLQEAREKSVLGHVRAECALEEKLLDNALACAHGADCFVPPHSGMRNEREPQLENVVRVHVRLRQRRPGAHVAPELACVLVLEHRHPVSHPAAMGLVFLLECEHRCQGALRRSAEVLVRLVDVRPVVLPEVLDVLGVYEAQVRLAVCTPQLGALAVRSPDVVLTDVLFGRGDVPVRPLLEDLLARVVEDVLGPPGHARAGALSSTQGAIRSHSLSRIASVMRRGRPH